MISSEEDFVMETSMQEEGEGKGTIKSNPINKKSILTTNIKDKPKKQVKFSNIEISKTLSESNENEKVVINVQVPLTIEVPKNLSVINDLHDKNGRFSQKI